MCPSVRAAVPGAAGTGRSGGRSVAAAPSLVTWTAFNPLAAYSGISSELSLFIQEHFRRKAPLCFAIYFDCQHPDLQHSPAGLPQKTSFQSTPS